MNLLRSRRGSISIFQIIIFTALLILTGIIVDVVRIMAAERKIQSALNTAVRSTLAGYDAELVGDYGIFGIDAKSKDSSINDNFIKYFEANLKERHDSLHFIKYSIDLEATKIEGERNLLTNMENDNVFREQIIKYMKYRAPINVTRGVIDKIMASGIFEKKEFAKKEKEARENRKEFDARTKIANESIKSINSKADEVNKTKVTEKSVKDYIKKVKELKADYARADGELSRMQAACEEYAQKAKEAGEFAQKVNSGQYKAVDASSWSDLKIDAFEGDARINTDNSKPDNILKEIEEARKLIEKCSGETDEIMDKAEPLQDEIDDWADRKESLKSANSRARRRINELQGEKDDIDHSEEIKSLRDEIDSRSDKISDLQDKIDDNLEEINDVKSRYTVDKLDEIIFEQEDKGKDYTSEQEAKGDADKKNLENLKGELNKLINDKVIKDDWLISSEDFRLARLEDSSKYGSLSKNYEESKAEERNQDIFRYMDMLQNALTNSVENVYVVEYIMDRFTYHTSITERDHYFNKGEVEYLLWGGNIQGYNITATMTSIGFLRFAINSIDYFATSKVPHPLYRLIYALARGLIQSFTDCWQLYKGEGISLCPSLAKVKNPKLEVNYADHLRIFLLLQSAANGEGQLNNIRQLIQVNLKKPDKSSNLENPDFELGNYDTVLRGRAVVKVNLWFLPILQIDKIKLGNFDKGSYKISKEIYCGY